MKYIEQQESYIVLNHVDRYSPYAPPSNGRYPDLDDIFLDHVYDKQKLGWRLVNLDVPKTAFIRGRQDLCLVFECQEDEGNFRYYLADLNNIVKHSSGYGIPYPQLTDTDRSEIDTYINYMETQDWKLVFILSPDQGTNSEKVVLHWLRPES